LSTISLPEDQSRLISFGLEHNVYTSVDIVTEEDPETLLSLDHLKQLKPGAKLALKKKLVELKVCAIAVCLLLYGERENNLALHII
jgi:hypothetical protein